MKILKETYHNQLILLLEKYPITLAPMGACESNDLTHTTQLSTNTN